jgi:hypothetical protein
MTDEELEQLLGRHRLAAPTSSLRARVLAAASGEPHRVRLGVFDWGLAAAAVVLFAAWAASERPDVPQPVSPDEIAWRQAVDQIAGALGPERGTRQAAELLVPRPESVASQVPQEVP